MSLLFGYWLRQKGALKLIKLLNKCPMTEQAYCTCLSLQNHQQSKNLVMQTGSPGAGPSSSPYCTPTHSWQVCGNDHFKAFVVVSESRLSLCGLYGRWQQCWTMSHLKCNIELFLFNKELYIFDIGTSSRRHCCRGDLKVIEESSKA